MTTPNDGDKDPRPKRGKPNVDYAMHLEYTRVFDRRIAAQTGVLIGLHAHYEAAISDAVFRLAGVDSSIGRVLTNLPSGVQKLNRLSDLCHARDIPVPAAITKKFKKEVEFLTDKRNGLAHGLWVRHKQSGKLYILLQHGKDDYPDIIGIVDRKAHPLPYLMVVGKILEYCKRIEQLIDQAELIYDELDKAMDAIEDDAFRDKMIQHFEDQVNIQNEDD